MLTFFIDHYLYKNIILILVNYYICINKYTLTYKILSLCL